MNSKKEGAVLDACKVQSVCAGKVEVAYKGALVGKYSTVNKVNGRAML